MRTVLAALVVTGALAVAVAGAAAQTLELPAAEQGFRTSWSSFEYEAGGFTVSCSVTLEGTFQSRSFAKTPRTAIGRITSARVAGERCAGGSVRFLTETLPWQLQYAGFTGTLPRITNVRLRLLGAALRVQPTGQLECLTRTGESHPAILAAHLRANESDVVSVEAEAAAEIPLEGFLCAFAGSGRLRGTSGALRTLNGLRNVKVFLGPVWVASVGDSYISGEAGRWASNTTSLGWAAVDRLGATAYFDNATNTAELIPFCHRSKSAEIHIGLAIGPSSVNFACSGATTLTAIDEEGHFKPGLDGYDVGGNQSQAVMLREFARTHNVKLVAVSIGGNDFHFATVVRNCIVDYLIFQNCSTENGTRQFFTVPEVTANRVAIKIALENVNLAMTEAGYADDLYKILVQDYESMIPEGLPGFRYPETYARYSTGGCGIYNADAAWAASAVGVINGTIWAAVAELPFHNVVTLELSSAFLGRRLCESSVGLLEERGYTTWANAGVIDNTEWGDQVQSLGAEPLLRQESLHPNYWGQKALRSCLRLAYNAGAPKSGTCTIAGPGKNALEEPNMQLTP